MARLQRAGRGAAQKANSSDHLHHHGKPQPETASDDGSLWLVFGTDSCFEGITALYYTRLTVWLNRMDAPWIWIDRARAPELAAAILELMGS